MVRTKPMNTLNMDDSFWKSRAWAEQAVREAAERVRQRLIENIELIKAADPDGQLAQVSAILKQKRGCRR